MSIYKQYEQEDLDLQYNNRHHVPDYETYLKKWKDLSRLAAKRIPHHGDIPYGTLSREKLDIFPAPGAGSKILIFIHGGYWHLFDKSLFYFVAEAFLRYGVTTVFPGYPLAPTVPVDQIVRSCCQAIRWVDQYPEIVPGTTNQLYIVGHSAGAHLAFMTLTSGSLPVTGQIRGVCGISGLYDLVPVQRSYINQVLGMDANLAIRNSPVRYVPGQPCPTIVAVGSEETEEYHAQSRALAEAWGSTIRPLELLTLPGLNHFSSLDALCNADSQLHQSVCAMMNLSSDAPDETQMISTQ
jgi:arylformamidase